MRRPRACAWLLLAGAALAALPACGAGGEGGRSAAPGADSTLVAELSRPAEGQVHLVRVISRPDAYAFEPREVRAAPGDVVRFVQTAYLPDVIAFDSAGLSPEAVRFLSENGLLDGLLLVEPGQIYEVSLHGAPPGRYPFLSRPHAGYGMRGVLVVGAPRPGG